MIYHDTCIYSHIYIYIYLYTLHIIYILYTLSLYIYIYTYMCIYIYICITCKHYVSPSPERAKNWRFMLIFQFSPLYCFSKTCPAGTHVGNFFIISLEPLKACSIEGVARWHSDKASGAFLSAQPNGIQNLLETWLSMQRGCSKDLNINVRKSTEYH